MRETIVVYCDDCPSRWLCEDKGHDCDYTRYIDKVVKEAPPLTPEQIDKLTVLFSQHTLNNPGL